MLGKLPWGWKLPILCVLFATCDGGLVKDPGPTTETPPGGQNAILTCKPTETWRTLEHDDFEVLPDGRLLVWQSRDSVNASSYALGGDGTASACLPPPRCVDGPVVVKAFYFATISVFFTTQAPLYVLNTLSVNRWSPLLYVIFFYVPFIPYIISPPFCYPKYLTVGFFVNLWYSVPSYLSLTGLHLAGGLAVLHSDVVLNRLAATGQIYVKRGTVLMKVFTRKMGLIGQGTACIGVVTFTLTYMLVMFRPFEDETLLFSPLRHHMHNYLPSCLVYLVVNLILAGLSACASHSAISGYEWLHVRNRHSVFFTFFLAAFANWMFGFCVTLFGRWDLWDTFVIFSFVFPVVLCCYIYSISRKVIYANRECVKIMETNGEVLTIWAHPPKSQEETGSDKEEQPTKREFELAFYKEETGAGKEKQPAEIEIIDQLALVSAKFGGDKEKQLQEEDFELALLI